MLRLAPTLRANPGKIGIIVLWLASAKKMAILRSKISLVIPRDESAIDFHLLYGFKTHEEASLQIAWIFRYCMDFQRFQVVTGPDRDIVIKLNSEAIVRVMNRTNLFSYESGKEYESYGPCGKLNETRIKVPSLGRWFIIVEDTQVSVEWTLA